MIAGILTSLTSKIGQYAAVAAGAVGAVVLVFLSGKKSGQSSVELTLTRDTLKSNQQARDKERAMHEASLNAPKDSQGLQDTLNKGEF